jgi:hypothetical protein
MGEVILEDKFDNPQNHQETQPLALDPSTANQSAKVNLLS